MLFYTLHSEAARVDRASPSGAGGGLGDRRAGMRPVDVHLKAHLLRGVERARTGLVNLEALADEDLMQPQRELERLRKREKGRKDEPSTPVRIPRGVTFDRRPKQRDFRPSGR